MKKFYIYNESAAERNAVYFDFDGKLEHVLGVTYIQETGGDPATDEDQDISLDDLKKDAITDVIECDAADEDYITGLCEAWGLI